MFDPANKSTIQGRALLRLEVISESPPKVLMRMLSATGNPQAKNCSRSRSLQKVEGTVLEVVDRVA